MPSWGKHLVYISRNSEYPFHRLYIFHQPNTNLPILTNPSDKQTTMTPAVQHFTYSLYPKPGYTVTGTAYSVPKTLDQWANRKEVTDLFDHYQKSGFTIILHSPNAAWANATEVQDTSLSEEWGTTKDIWNVQTTMNVLKDGNLDTNAILYPRVGTKMAKSLWCNLSDHMTMEKCVSASFTLI